jgi:hypothetical protein
MICYLELKGWILNNVQVSDVIFATDHFELTLTTELWRW